MARFKGFKDQLVAIRLADRQGCRGHGSELMRDGTWAAVMLYKFELGQKLDAVLLGPGGAKIMWSEAKRRRLLAPRWRTGK